MKVTPILTLLQDISIKVIGIIIIGKNNKNYHPGKHWAFLDLFESHVKNVLIKNMVHTSWKVMKITKICYIFGKNARNNCFKSKYQQFWSNISISLMTKDLAQIKVYTYFKVQYRRY